MLTGKLAHLRVELITVHDRHHEVEKDHVRVPGQPTECVAAIARARDFVTLFAQQDRVEVSEVRDVLDDQHSPWRSATTHPGMMDLNPRNRYNDIFSACACLLGRRGARALDAGVKGRSGRN